MENNRSLNEAILRAHPATEKSLQSQEQLYNMARPVNDKSSSLLSEQQVPLNESHINLMKSWMNLRQMDSALAERFGNEIME